MQKMKIQEEWKVVAECNGEYKISNYGEVKSFKTGNWVTLKPRVNKAGYLSIAIHRKGKVKVYRINRLVALTFIPNPENKPQVNHKDGNKLNNFIDNLEWMTQNENVQHAWDNGLYESTRKAISKAQSKPVIDKVTGKNYPSLKSACADNNEVYHIHKQRASNKSNLQRFFYAN